MGGGHLQHRHGTGPHLLLYDGTCGLCNGIVRAVLRRDRAGLFHFASLQSRVGSDALARFGASAADLNSFAAIVNYRRPSASCLTKARAAMFVLESLGWPWRAAAWLRPVPTGVLDPVYDLVARNRYRFFPRVEHCPLPRPEHRDRFLDFGGADPAVREVP